MAKTPKPKEDVQPEAPKEPPKPYADDDNSIDARMWRLLQDHRRMGSRP